MLNKTVHTFAQITRIKRYHNKHCNFSGVVWERYTNVTCQWTSRQSGLHKVFWLERQYSRHRQKKGPRPVLLWRWVHCSHKLVAMQLDRVHSPWVTAWVAQWATAFGKKVDFFWVCRSGSGFGLKQSKLNTSSYFYWLCDTFFRKFKAFKEQL